MRIKMKTILHFILFISLIFFTNCSSKEDSMEATIIDKVEVDNNQNIPDKLLNSNSTGSFTFSPTGPLSN